jgi:N-acetyl-alpha-D-muramate 1-phosphate uridylyltransferase
MSLPVAILAGGKATRLYPLTETLPKSLLEVGGKPFIAHQVELLHRNHIARIVVCLGYLGHRIQQRLGDGSKFGLSIEYVNDGPILLGTGGALKNALPVLGDAFFVLYGDSFLDIDYARVETEFLQSGASGLMTVYRNSGQWDRSNVLFENGRIVEYDKRNPAPEMRHIDYGLGVFRKAAFHGVPEHQFCDLADVYGGLIRESGLAGYEVHERFYEIGSPEGLAETRLYLERR